MSYNNILCISFFQGKGLMETYWLLGTIGEFERCQALGSSESFDGVSEPAFLHDLG